ncbi:GNAT family N-acetyltransferase [Streptomyces daliensis]|uniref:GNAT family N-acetyltransferase n=1 Tax=Streptomyces daliensis TaxID=299421 RepID=A0A8T4J300_9ACTN|nr:GNAT family N-acetyltransferase [Streptomyces daliensis]
MPLTIKHYGHADAPALREVLLDIHDAVYRDDQDTFHSRARFAEFVDSWSGKGSWSCVIGYDGDEAVGFAYGAAFQPGGWWKGSPLPQDYGSEATSFALSELMIREGWRKTGASSQLHDALVSQRAEDRVTLLVDTEHPKVQKLYESWGYRKVQEQRPFSDSPLFAVMVKDLRNGT